MKLTGAQASGFIAKPAPGHSGILLFGADAMRVALKRQALIKALAGTKAEEEMRLTRMTGADLRSDKAAAFDAIKAVGFFPGERVVFVDGVTDGLTEVLAEVLGDWGDGDATLVCTAGALNAKSKLRKLFESDRRAVAIGIYDDPPGRDEIDRALRAAGLRDLPQPAMAALVTLAQSVDPGELMQVIEKLGLYKHGDSSPVTVEDIEAVAPGTLDADVDDAIHAAAEGRDGDAVLTLRWLAGQGVNATTVCIMAARHFQMLHVLAADPAGADRLLARNRVFGPRRDRLVRQARAFGTHGLEDAMSEIMEVDLALRSTRRPPEMAALERALVRIARMKDRRKAG